MERKSTQMVCRAPLRPLSPCFLLPLNHHRENFLLLPWHFPFSGLELSPGCGQSVWRELCAALSPWCWSLGWAVPPPAGVAVVRRGQD